MNASLTVVCSKLVLARTTRPSPNELLASVQPQPILPLSISTTIQPIPQIQRGDDEEESFMCVGIGLDPIRLGCLKEARTNIERGAWGGRDKRFFCSSAPFVACRWAVLTEGEKLAEEINKHTVIPFALWHQ
jgi:hypothetical protein